MLATRTQMAQSSQGYVAANRRPACRNCAHVHELPAPQRSDRPNGGLRCQIGGFLVTVQAMCDQWVPIRCKKV